jgi:hypothetical protein
VLPGGTEDLHTTVTTSDALTGAIVDFEVYDATGAKVHQTFQTGVTFAAHVPQTFGDTWAVPASQAPGTYTLKIGIFGANWRPTYAWDNTGASFTVATATTTSTPTSKHHK